MGFDFCTLQLITPCSQRKIPKMRISALALSFALLALFMAPLAKAQPAENPYDGDWHFALTPYLWVPGVTGNLRFDVPPGGLGGAGLLGGRVDVDISASDVLAKLNFAFMAAGQARKGNWSINTDFIYLSLGGQASTVGDITGPGGNVEIPIDVGTKSGLSGFIWTLTGGYTLVNKPGGSLDLFAGFRDLQLKASVDWRFSGPIGSLLPSTGSFSKTGDVWDAIVGIRGRINLDENGNWFIPYYADIGAGSSSTTWQALAGVGYSFGWGNLSFSYRYLNYYTSKSFIIKDLTLAGPTLGATFHF